MSTLTFFRVKTFKKEQGIHSNLKPCYIYYWKLSKNEKKKTDRYPLNPEAVKKRQEMHKLVKR